MPDRRGTRLRQRVLVVEQDTGLQRKLRSALERAGLDVAIADAAPADPQADAVLIRATAEAGAYTVPVLAYRVEPLGLRSGFVLQDGPTAAPLETPAFGRLVRARLRPGPLPALLPLVSVHGLRVDTSAYRVYVHGDEVTLTALELRLLAMLLSANGRVLRREDLLRQVWGIVRRVDSRTVDTHVKRLRRKLGACAVLVQTVRSVGYRIGEGVATA